MPVYYINYYKVNAGVVTSEAVMDSVRVPIILLRSVQN